MEGLFHVAKKLSAGGLRDRGGRNAVDPDLPGIRLIESQKQLEQGTFSGSGAAEKRQLVAGLHSQIQVAQDGFVPVVGEGDVAKFDEGRVRESLYVSVGICRFRFRRSCRNGSICLDRLFLRQPEKLLNPVNARYRRLDSLNLHSQTLHRGEDLGNIVHDGHSGTGGHTKECQHPGIARSG